MKRRGSAGSGGGKPCASEEKAGVRVTIAALVEDVMEFETRLCGE